jgi:hypothetical protein
MAIEDPPHALEPNPVVRFRMRTLLWATTIIAVLAAIAGPYYRRQSAAAQPQLLIFWSGLVLASAIWMWFQWRSAAPTARNFGPIRFVLRTAWVRQSIWPQSLGLAFALAVWFAMIAGQTERVVRDADRRQTSVVAAIGRFATGGMFTSCLLLWAIPRPALIGNDGVSTARGYGPWKFIRHAEWLANRPGVLKFRRLDGDIYVDVPERLRDEVEAFVRAKTTFVEPAPDPVSRDAVAERGGDV